LAWLVDLPPSTFNGRFTGERSVYFVQLFRKRTFGDEWVVQIFLQSTNRQCQSTEANSNHWPQPVA